MAEFKPFDAIGVKRIKVIGEKNDAKGRPGYEVEYDDGYRSWSPKEILDKYYRNIDDGIPDTVRVWALEGHEVAIKAEFGSVETE